MNFKNLLLVGSMALFLFSCGGEKQEESAEEVADTTAVKESETEAEGDEKKEEEVSIVNPFPSFPKMATQAKEGEVVLTPSLKWQKDATKDGAEKVTFIFYNAKMGKPGDERSDVEFTFDGTQNIPNYMIVPINPAKGVKNGDILLSWWQSGSGMQRCYVTDASNPDEPIVTYLDIAYDNPAKNKEGVPIGQMQEKLKPNSFAKVGGMWMPGSTVAAKDGNSWKRATVIAKKDGKVLTVGFAGKMKIYEENQCRGIEVAPKVKTGDTVQVPYIGSYKEGVVKKVEGGRVFTEIEFGGQKKEVAVALCDVATNLEM